MASQCVFCGCIVLTTHPRNPQPKFEGVRRSFLLRSISTLQVRATKPEQTNRQNASFDRLGERQGRVDLWGPPVTCVCVRVTCGLWGPRVTFVGRPSLLGGLGVRGLLLLHHALRHLGLER